MNAVNPGRPKKTYAALLFNFISWAEKHDLKDWKEVKLPDLMTFLEEERTRQLKNQAGDVHAKAQF